MSLIAYYPRPNELVDVCLDKHEPEQKRKNNCDCDWDPFK